MDCLVLPPRGGGGAPQCIVICRVLMCMGVSLGELVRQVIND